MFMLATLLWFGSCNHCISARFLWSKKCKRPSSNHGLCSFRSDRLRLSLLQIVIFSLMFSKTLFMSSLSFKFSKDANLFEISIWYCSLNSIPFCFLKLNLSASNFCAACLLTSKLCLTCATARQWSVSQSAPLTDLTSSILKYHLQSINMWSVWLSVFLWGEVQVYTWRFRWGNNLTIIFFYVEKFIILTPLSLLSWCRLSFLTVCLKTPSLLKFSWKSNRIFTLYLRKDRKSNPIPHKNCLLNRWICNTVQQEWEKRDNMVSNGNLKSEGRYKIEPGEGGGWRTSIMPS